MKQSIKPWYGCQEARDGSEEARRTESEQQLRRLGV